MHSIHTNLENSLAVVDYLVKNKVRFALYQLPNDPDLVFVMQQSSDCLVLTDLRDLKDKKGFVIAPFRLSTNSPAVVISPDVLLRGDKEISLFLTETFSHKPFATSSDAPSVEMLTEENIQATYKTSYSHFYQALEQKEFDKLVLSRPLDCKRKADFSPIATFLNACKKYTDSFVFLCNTPELGCWLGSSPELLLGGKGHDWQTVSLAGTKESGSKEDWDVKNRFEQEIVTNYMESQLAKAGCTFRYNEPFSVNAGHLMHLKTEFSIRIDNPQDKIGDVLHLLHPSPAVCGFPKEKAFDFILENEGYDRQCYSGFLGYLDVAGQTDLYVNLRSMQIYEKSLRLYAGGGLVSSSDMELEWQETEKKLQTMLSIIN